MRCLGGSRWTQHRLKSEYDVEVRCETMQAQHARWVEGSFDPAEIERLGNVLCLHDVERRPLLLFKNDFWLHQTLKDHAHLRFIAAVQPGRSERAAA